jgi:hypothetical protein
MKDYGGQRRYLGTSTAETPPRHGAAFRPGNLSVRLAMRLSDVLVVESNAGASRIQSWDMWRSYLADRREHGWLPI